jgi:pheromone shutdown protein TraB
MLVEEVLVDERGVYISSSVSANSADFNKVLNAFAAERPLLG